MASIALVHSPLVGATTWRWVADALRARGHRVTVAAAVAGAGGWEPFVEAVAAQADGARVLVGHSGAGPLLAQIRARLAPPPDTLVFVDAGLPPADGEAALLPPDLLAQLRPLAADGVLPPWSEWFGPGVMEQLVPDDATRAAVVEELPRLPLAYFDGRVPATEPAPRCGYVQLSEPYAAEAAEAARRGWLATELPGTHLDLVTRPDAVAAALLDVLERLSAP